MLREEEEEDDRRSASAGGSSKDDAEAEEADRPATFWVSPGRSMAWTGTQRRVSVRASFRSGPFPFLASSTRCSPPHANPTLKTPIVVCVRNRMSAVWVVDESIVCHTAL